MTWELRSFVPENKCNGTDCPLLSYLHKYETNTSFAQRAAWAWSIHGVAGSYGEWERAVTASGVSQESSGRALGSWEPLKEKNCSKSFQEQRGEWGKSSSQWRPFCLLPSLRLRSAWPLWNEGQRNIYSTCSYLSFASFLFQKTFHSFQNSTCKPPRFQTTSREDVRSLTTRGGQTLTWASSASFLLLLF